MAPPKQSEHDKPSETPAADTKDKDEAAEERPAETSDDAGNADAPSAQEKHSAAVNKVKEVAKPTEDTRSSDCLMCCGMAMVAVFILVGGLIAVLWALDAPLPWHLVGLGQTPLTQANWEKMTSGRKQVFVKFYAPYCGHCKSMKPDWEKLTDEYKDNADVLIAQVDCTSSGRSLCESAGVKGFPTLRYGFPDDVKMMEEYKGDRTYAKLSEFAKENLAARCSPDALDLCTETEKATVTEYLALGPEKLKERIDEKVSAVSQIETAFKEQTEALTKRYREEKEAHDKRVDALRGPLGLVRAVHQRQKESAEAQPDAGAGEAKQEL